MVMAQTSRAMMLRKKSNSGFCSLKLNIVLPFIILLIYQTGIIQKSMRLFLVLAAESNKHSCELKVTSH